MLSLVSLVVACLTTPGKSFRYLEGSGIDAMTGDARECSMCHVVQVITNTVSVDYLSKPVEVFQEMHRVLKPGGKAIMSFSNRCFPTKGERSYDTTADVSGLGQPSRPHPIPPWSAMSLPVAPSSLAVD